MISREQLVDELAMALDLDEATVAWIARKLEDAGLLPTDTGTTIAPLHAARLLVAIMGVARPLDAAEIVEAFEKTTAHRVFLQDPELGRHRTLSIEDADIPEGAGGHFFEITRDFIGAVAHLIHRQATAPGRAPLPRFICLRRDASAPLAKLSEITWTTANGRPGLFTIIFTRRDDCGHADDMLLQPRLEIHATVPGETLCKLGRLFTAPGAETCIADVRDVERGEAARAGGFR